MRIPFNVNNPEKTYRRYFISKRINVVVNILNNELRKSISMCVNDVKTELDPSQFTKELYIRISESTTPITFIDIYGKEVSVNISNVYIEVCNNCLYIIDRNDYIDHIISMDDIDHIIEELDKFSNSCEFVQKYKKIIYKDFLSFSKDDVMLLYNADMDIAMYKNELYEKCKTPNFKNKLEKYVYESIIFSDYAKCREYYTGNRYISPDIAEEFEKILDRYENNFLGEFKKTDIFESFVNILQLFDYDVDKELNKIDQNRNSEEYDYKYNEVINILFWRAEICRGN